MRGAGITAPSPWDTAWARSPSSKLPISIDKHKTNGKSEQMCYNSYLVHMLAFSIKRLSKYCLITPLQIQTDFNFWYKCLHQ